MPTHVQRLSIPRSWLEQVYVVIVPAFLVGVLVGGPALRLGMLLLRVTSPDSVDGVQSDDDFTIGQVTLVGTYNLFLIGTATGFLSCLAWLIVERWLVGTRRYQLFTVFVSGALIVGPLLIHDDGIDFHALEPLWLAIAVFLLIPALVAVAAPVALSAMDRHPLRGPVRVVIPVLCFLLVPQILVVAALVALGLFPVVLLRQTVQARILALRVGATAVRALFLVVPAIGAAALGGDLLALAD